MDVMKHWAYLSYTALAGGIIDYLWRGDTISITLSCIPGMVLFFYTFALVIADNLCLYMDLAEAKRSQDEGL